MNKISDTGPPTCRLQFQPGVNAGFSYAYRLAGQTFASDRNSPEIASFRTPGHHRQYDPKDTLPAGGANSGDLVFEGKAWLCRQWRLVSCRVSPRGFRIFIDGVGGLFVAADGRHVAFTQLDKNVVVEDVLEAMLGPGVILSLALSGTWCLHASAILTNNGVTAFVGNSGFGKSTLADFFHGSGVLKSLRVVDDILPVRMEGQRLLTLPHFPQLKIPSDNQPGVALPETLPLHCIYLLAGPDVAAKSCTIEPLSARSAATALIGQTVSAKLFNKKLLRHHLADCVQMATLVPFKRLSFPYSMSQLPHLSEVLQADLLSSKLTCFNLKSC